MSKKSRHTTHHSQVPSETRTFPVTLTAPPPLVELVGPAVAGVFERFFEHLAELEEDGIDVKPIRAAMLFMVPHVEPHQSTEQDPDLRHMVSCMRQAGVAEAAIFAFEMTGRLVTETNRHLLDDEDLGEWFLYVDAYETFGEAARLAYGIPVQV